VLLLPVIL